VQLTPLSTHWAPRKKKRVHSFSDTVYFIHLIKYKIVVFDAVYILSHFNIILKYNGMSSTKVQSLYSAYQESVSLLFWISLPLKLNYMTTATDIVCMLIVI
jgi:hypothetical protein